MRIALCDDDTIFLDKFDALVRRYISVCFDDIKIAKYTNGLKLLEHHKNDPFDVIFLDIDMPGINGFEIAGELNRIKKNCFFIFVTNHCELVYKCFDFQPFNFINKNDSDQLNKKLKKIVCQLSRSIKQQETLILEDRLLGRVAAALKDIVYVESCGHFVRYHIDDRSAAFQVRANIGALEERYRSSDFIRIHRRFLVNMRHILNVDTSNSSVRLKQGTELPLSRSLKQTVNESFTEYLRSIT